jgi:hypothetical protein
MLPSISSSISLVSAGTATQTASGPAAPLGSTYTIPASESDRGLFVVNSSTGAVVGDHRVVPGTGEVLVSLSGGDGELELIYVKTAELVERGKPVTAGASAPYTVTKTVATAAAEPSQAILGIALFNIAAGKCAWVVKRGVVLGLGGDTSAAGMGLEVNADSEFIAMATADSPARVTALATVADATLGKVFINA